MPRKTFLAVLGVIMLLVTAAGAPEARNEGLDRIIKAGAIRIAVPDDFPPFGKRKAPGL